jgi:hypothetical protein
MLSDLNTKKNISFRLSFKSPKRNLEMENKSLLNNEYIVNIYHNIPQKKNENDILNNKKTKKL